MPKKIDKDFSKNLAFSIINGLDHKGFLRQDVRILPIEKVTRQLIDEFMSKLSETKPDRGCSVKVHWLGSDGMAWCHTLAKNPRKTTSPDLVSCRRCLPEALANCQSD